MLAKFLRNHPPSPPQSPPAGDIGPDAQSDFYRITDMAAPQSFTSSSPYYPSDNEYLPMRHGVNTPPLTADDALALGSRRSSPHWSSPMPRSVPMSVQGNVRVSRASANNRRRRNKKDKMIIGENSKLPGPLSELTKHMAHIPIRDMEALVNRPNESRRAEAVKKGKIVRPMNSFILYRSAYTERAKEWCAQNNHQIVSRVCGLSWPLEPPTVREKYEALALRERDSHRQAHPNYKFAPTKANGVPKKNSTNTDTDTETNNRLPPPRNQRESPDLDEHASSSSLLDNGRITEIDSSFDSRSSTPFIDTPNSSFDGSSWLMGRSLSGGGMMTPPEPPAQHYLQTSIHPSITGAHVEDVHFHRVGVPETQFNNTTPALSGLPGASHHELLQPPTTAPVFGQVSESDLDPRLLTTYHHPHETPTPGSSTTTTGVDSQEYNTFQYYWQEDPATNCYLPVGPSLNPSSLQPYQPLEPPSHSYSPGFHHSGSLDGHNSWGLAAQESSSSFEDSKDLEHWFGHQEGF